MLNRESGSPNFAGSSQASALICTTTSGGKNPGAAGSGSFLQAGEAFIEEAFAPEADHVSTDRERRADLIVGPTFGGKENDSGTQDDKIRQRIFSCATLQSGSFFWREPDFVRALPRHTNISSRLTTVSEEPKFNKSQYAAIFMRLTALVWRSLLRLVRPRFAHSKSHREYVTVFVKPRTKSKGLAKILGVSSCLCVLVVFAFRRFC
jgi:hypothetical protein